LSQVTSDDPLAPRFLAGDRETGLIVIEDVGDSVGLDRLLLGDEPTTGDSLIEYATLLGRLHALTAGKQATFDHLRDALGPRDKGTDHYTYQWLATTFHRTLDSLSITPPAGVDGDLAALIGAIREPGPFWAYTHGDPCPDNVVRANGRWHLLDFEFGDFRHALTDGVYGRILFPSCWCVGQLPAPVSRQMEAVYRTALARGCPAAADDTLFHRAIVEGCASWVLTMCNRHSLVDLLAGDQTWGTATLRQRVIQRAGILAQTTE
jgi:hypothetical protein